MSSTTTTVDPSLTFSLDGAVSASPLLPSERIYYRSKLFTARSGINPLMAAASPLFSLACFLAENTEAPATLEKLTQNLHHEIKAFENNAKAQHYHSETIRVTRYLLCAFLDEMLAATLWGQHYHWLDQHSLLFFFHQERHSGERFFFILDKLSQDPEMHVDLLELIYVCLKLGYQGKYRNLPEEQKTLHQLTENLFACILFHRGELKKELHLAPPAEQTPPVAKITLPLWLIISFTLVVFITVYSSFSYMLGNNHAETVYDSLNSMIPTLTSNG